MATVFPLQTVQKQCQQKLTEAGMADELAVCVARVLCFGEATCPETHGLNLLPLYLREIEARAMAISGRPEVVNESAACLRLDGLRLPGAWLMEDAIRKAILRAAEFGVGVVSVCNSHHTGCLSAHLEQATSQGYVVQIMLTDPSHSSVAPWGSTTPVMTSNPLAFGAPGNPDPIWIDMATSAEPTALLPDKLPVICHFQRR